MDTSLACATSGFLKRARRILERVEHRCAVTARDEASVYRMRYDAYTRLNLIQPREDCRLFDARYDRSFNHYNVMTFLDDAFVSTLRLHVDSGENAVLPSRDEFDDVLGPILRAGCVVIDLGRIAAKAEYALNFNELPYFTLRAAWLAAEHFGADAIVSRCFDEHRAFYSRVFGFQPLCPPRASAQVGRPITCMALDYQARKQDVECRYPFFWFDRGRADVDLRPTRTRPREMAPLRSRTGRAWFSSTGASTWRSSTERWA